MNTSEGLNIRDYTATGINKEDELYKVIFSDDEGSGASAIELDRAVGFINYYTKTDYVRNHRGYTLEMIIKEFTGFRRMLYEPDAVYLRRFLAITERKKDEVWGTKWNMQHVFESYFSGVKIYVCESTDDLTKNLLENGDFEEDEDGNNNGWELAGDAEFVSDSRFSGRLGLALNGPGTCRQDVPGLSEGVYVFHFFIDGKCGVKIKNAQGQYWNSTAKPNSYILAWQEGEFINEFEGERIQCRYNFTYRWQDVHCFIVLPKKMDITIEFVSLEEGQCKIDYARLFKRPPNPSYTVLVQYEGYQVMDTSLHLGKGKDDPIDGLDYGRESYYDHHYIVGRKGAHRRDVFNSLLEIIRPVGIQPFLEFVEREYVD